MNGAKRTFDSFCEEGALSGPASEAAIAHAQAQLRMTFPAEYQDFLSHYGAAIVCGAEVYGLPDTAKNAPPLWSDVTSVTETLRNIGQSGTEDEYFLPISEDGTGVYFFLNTRASPRTEIWAVGPGVNKVVSSSFYEFLVDLAEGRVSL